MLYSTVHCQAYTFILQRFKIFNTSSPDLDVVLEPRVAGIVRELEVKAEELHRLLDGGEGSPLGQSQAHLHVQVGLLFLKNKIIFLYNFKSCSVFSLLTDVIFDIVSEIHIFLYTV